MQAIHGLHLSGMLRMSKSAVLPICLVSGVDGLRAIHGPCPHFVRVG